MSLSKTEKLSESRVMKCSIATVSLQAAHLPPNGSSHHHIPNLGAASFAFGTLDV